MPNYEGNPNIARYGRRSRFGQPGGAAPRAAQAAASRPWSIRRAVTRLAAAEFPAYASITEAKLLRVLAPAGTYTAAQLMAVKWVLLALAGNAAANQRVTEMVDGKLEAPVMQAPGGLAAIIEEMG